MWREDLVVRSVALKDLLELIEALDSASDTWLREVGIDSASLKSDTAYVSWISMCQLVQLAAARLKLPDLGLRWAMAQKPDFSTVGPLAIIALTVPDVRTFARLWIEYDLIHTNGSYTKIVENEAEGTFRAVVHYSSAAPDSRHLKEYFALTLYQLAKIYGSSQYPVLRIGFPHKPISDPSVYADYFDCEIEFNAEQTYVEFPIGFLNYKLGRGFSAARKAFEAYMHDKLKKAPTHNMSMTAHVAQLLPSIFGVGASDINFVAQALSMNTKKLQRLLSDEGTSYSAIRDEVRESLALQLLRDSEVAITRIAALLDYASPIAFRNACKRWTGMSPRQYRYSVRK